MVLHSKNGYPEFCSKTSRITYLTFLLSEKIKQNYSPQGLETKPTALIIDVIYGNLYESFPRFDANMQIIPIHSNFCSQKGDQIKVKLIVL